MPKSASRISSPLDSNGGVPLHLGMADLPQPSSKRAERAARLAAALRQNLWRRKEQARAQLELAQSSAKSDDERGEGAEKPAT